MAALGVLRGFVHEGSENGFPTRSPQWDSKASLVDDSFALRGADVGGASRVAATLQLACTSAVRHQATLARGQR